MVAMTNTEKLICALIGPAKGDIRPLAMSIDLLNETLFLEDGENYELRIGGNIFAEVARRLGKTPAAVTRASTGKRPNAGHVVTLHCCVPLPG